MSDSLIMGDTALTKFTYLGKSFPVFVTKAFMVQFPTISVIPNGADFKRHIFMCRSVSGPTGRNFARLTKTGSGMVNAVSCSFKLSSLMT
jgi:hypothetical protein